MTEPASNSAEDFSAWIGRKEVVEDDLSLAHAQAAAATFDAPSFVDGTPLPPLWHWFYFLPKAAQAQLGSDGHPQRQASGFLPPIPYPRRMFAGARLQFHRPLICGESARREAVIRKVVAKKGSSGALAFVTVEYRIRQNGALCIEEEQDIVYREPGPRIPPPQSAPFPEPPATAWWKVVTPDTRLLFRFSALTFNAHRIHYDRPYATTEEGYPGLVVHGPLTALLLLRLVHEHTSRSVTAFSFRSQAPLFLPAPLRLVGTPALASGVVDLQAQGPGGKVAMTATAEL